jgi:DNA-binding transcriptional LysR family regulator
MDAIRSDHGGLSFELEDLESADALVALDCGRVDVAIVDEGDWRELKRGGLRLEATRLFDDPLVVSYRPGHELAEPESLEWSALASQRWIVGQPPWAFLNPVYDHCRRAGFEPNVIARVRDRSAALGLVGQGWGICVIPRLVVLGQSEGVAWREVKPTLCRTSVAVTRQSGANVPAIHSLLERLSAAAEEVEPAAIS